MADFSEKRCLELLQINKVGLRKGSIGAGIWQGQNLKLLTCSLQKTRYSSSTTRLLILGGW